MIKRSVIAVVAGLAMLLPVGQAWADTTSHHAGAEIVRSEAIVKFKSADDADAILADFGYRVIHQLGNEDDSTFLIELDRFVAIGSQLSRLQARAEVDYVEPNYLLQLASTPDDPDYSSLWGLQDGFGANASGAWAQGVTGSNQVYVAVIDSGIDVTHPDLAANMWVNSAEANGAGGADSDGNGFIDDVHGFDFLNNDGSVFDANEHPHGSHVAGTIAAVGNNGLGITGMAWNLKLISVKFIDANGGGTVANAIRSIDYVTMLRTQRGLNIIATNNSYGGPQYSAAMNDAIRRGGDAGILFVAAAGNGSADLEGRNDFPAVYNCHTELREWDCVVSVAASSTSGSLASFSNYGATRVDLAAPGVGILSTVPGGGYELKSGTSMAAPHVTGALALCMAAFRGVSARDARELLLQTVQPVAALAGKVASGGILNASDLISGCAAQGTGLSGSPSELQANAYYTDRVRLEWNDTAKGEFGYTLQVATGPAGCTGSFQHLAFIGPGLNSYPVTGLAESEFYCFRVRATRDSTNSSWSTSNVAITWSTNAPFITGRVTMADGVTPVRNARVSWRATATIGAAVEVYTDAAGQYVLQASAGTPGLLGLSNGKTHRDKLSTPALPYGLSVLSSLTINEDTVINLKAPAVKQTILKLVDHQTNQPVAGARLYADRNSIFRCKTNHGYKHFGTQAPTDCGFYPGSAWSEPKRTDSNGELTLALPTAALFGDGNYSFTLVPDQARSNLVSFNINTSADLPAVTQLKTSELLTVSGRVLNSRGEASSAQVRWVPATGASAFHSVTVNANETGDYSIQLPKSTAVILTMGGPQGCGGGDCSDIKLPLRMLAGGRASFDQNSTVNIVAPATDLVTIRVVDQASGQPVPNAPVRPVRTTIEYCDKSSTYKPFEQATEVSCSFYSVGNPANAVANSRGEIRLHLPTATHYRRASYDISATRPGAASSAATISFAASSGNLKIIELPSAGVVISGRVQTADGVPVSGAVVHFGVVGRPSSASVLKSTSDAQGNYSMTVPAGELSELWVYTPNMHQSFEYSLGGYTTPALPIGSNFGGRFTPTANSTINLTAPEMATVTLTAVDAYSLDPVPNARFTTDRYTTVYCDTRGYKAFAAASTTICNFRILGPSNVPPIANADGQIQIQLPLNSLLALSEYVISAIHPFTNTRVGQQRFTVSSASPMNIQLVLPGTPSVPSQPTVTAGDSSVTLGWTEPWNGGAFIDYYRVWFALDARGPYQRVNSGSCAGNIAPELRSCEVTDLVPGVTYYFAIIAHNVVGASDMSASVASMPTGSGGFPPGSDDGPVGGGGASDSSFPALSPSRQNVLESGRTRGMVRADGSVAAVAATAEPGSNLLRLDSGATTVSVLAPGGLSLADSGSVSLHPLTDLAVSVSGLKPGSIGSLLLVPSGYYGFTTSEFGSQSSQVLVLATGEVDLAGEMQMSTTLEVAEGEYQLQLVAMSNDGELIALVLQANVFGFESIVPSVDAQRGPPRGWTKARADGTIKFYARNIVGAGKVRFILNGREVSWIRAVDASEPRLNVGLGAARDGLVRTVGRGSRWSLVTGRNVLEIWVGDTRLVYRVFKN